MAEGQAGQAAVIWEGIDMSNKGTSLINGATWGNVVTERRGGKAVVWLDGCEEMAVSVDMKLRQMAINYQNWNALFDWAIDPVRGN